MPAQMPPSPACRRRHADQPRMKQPWAALVRVLFLLRSGIAMPQALTHTCSWA
jgi:hypothetical protein